MSGKGEVIPIRMGAAGMGKIDAIVNEIGPDAERSTVMRLLMDTTLSTPAAVKTLRTALMAEAGGRPSTARKGTSLRVYPGTLVKIKRLQEQTGKDRSTVIRLLWVVGLSSPAVMVQVRRGATSEASAKAARREARRPKAKRAAAPPANLARAA